MENTARKQSQSEQERSEQEQREQALRALLDEIRVDAQKDARRYLEETLVPGGGE